MSSRLISGVTPDYVADQIRKNPLIYNHWKKNDKIVQKGLVDGFMRMPTKVDCPGFIYGFRTKE